jgi:hypothetical protein
MLLNEIFCTHHHKPNSRFLPSHPVSWLGLQNFLTWLAAKEQVTSDTIDSDFLCISLQTDCTILKVAALQQWYRLSIILEKNLNIIGRKKKGVLEMILHNFSMLSVRNV